MWGTYALVQLPSGALSDRFGDAWTVRIALLTAVACCFLLAAAPTFRWFTVAVGLLGVSAGLYYNAATALLVGAVDRIDFAIGTHRIGSKVAGLAAPGVAVGATTLVGWRGAFVAADTLSLVGLGVFSLFVSSSPAGSHDGSSGSLSETIRGVAVLRRPRIAYTTALLATGEFVAQATMSFFAVFLVSYQGLTLSTASLLFTVLFVASGLAQPVMGRLSDRIGRVRAVLLSTGLGAVGYLSLVVGDGLATSALSTAVAGWSLSWTAPLQSRAFDDLDDASQATGFGTVRTAYLLVGATGSVTAGTVAEAAGWAVAFGGLGAVLAVVCLVVAGNQFFDGAL